MKNSITEKTTLALDSDVLRAIQRLHFCIVGCGGVGAAFADMLIRTGAQKISLIDGDEVEVGNLNRMPYIYSDKNNHKTEALAEHLKRINPDIEALNCESYHFKALSPGDERAKSVRDLVANADIVIIAMDKNFSRIECEKLCRELCKKYLSVGVQIDKANNTMFYECAWKPRVPEERAEEEGYGVGNGSFASIVMEATAVGFNLLLHHLKNGKNATCKRLWVRYKNFVPVACGSD